MSGQARLTYSSLVVMARRLEVHSPAQFGALLGEGTEALVKGLHVRWRLGPRASKFEVRYRRRNGDHVDLAVLRSNVRDGVPYTSYELKVLPTTRMSAVEKHLPFRFPDGVKFGWQGCNLELLRPTDGLVLGKLRWIQQTRGQPGAPNGPLVVNDSTGEFVVAKACEALKLGSFFQNGYYDNRFHPQASKTRLEWIKSVASMPGIDQRKTVECALRACKAAMELTAEHPHLGMMLLPAEVVENSDTSRVHRPSGRPRPVMILTDHDLTKRWLPPEVIVFWHDFYEAGDGEAHWSTLSMTIPPHGHEWLDHRMVGRSPLEMRGSDRPLPMSTLVAWKPTAPLSEELMNQRYGSLGTAGRIFAGIPHVVGAVNWTEREQHLALWHENQDKVLVTLKSEADHPVMRGGAFAMTPEHVFSAVQGKFVLDSLPMI